MTGNILISCSKSSGQKRIGSHACRNLLENRLPAFTFEQLEARELLTYTPTPHPYPGISFIQYSITFSSTQSADINIAEIDLSTPGLNLQTTIKGDTPDTIAKTNLNYINDEHAQLAVNGNFFTPVPHSSNVSVDLYGFAASLIVADAQSGHTGTVVSPYQSNTSPIDYAVMPYAPAINIATPLNHSTHLVASIVHYDAAHPQSNLPAEVYNGSVELGNALSGSAQIIIDCPPIPPSTDPTPCINP